MTQDDITQAVEDRVDNWLNEMATNRVALTHGRYLDESQRLNTELDLYDGLLLPLLMRTIAKWDGSMLGAWRTMKDLHNILADELQAKARMQIENERRPIR